MKVKICGITNIDDALYAAELGADALGFIFVKSSPRYIAPSAARKIIRALPPFVVPIGVFVDVPQEEIIGVIEQTGINCVQLHGNESPKQLANFPVPVYKSFRVDSSFNPEILRRYKGSAYLLDTKISGKLGGTGQTFDWEIAIKAKEYGRIILAGGLTPENIIEAAQKVRPYAVDVNSGVEESPEKKSRSKLKLLFEKLNQIESV
ncbi:MAG: phosphoribosylanthranilate isomerase [Ignavibacteriales bacterium]|nr:phosphoribosylanthranilate isomerase [Ignavibacteriales bacterium]